MPHSSLLNSFLNAGNNKGIRMIAARGLAPLAAHEMLELLVHLRADCDPEIAAQALVTLQAWSEEDILAQIQRRECSARTLEYVAAAATSEALLVGIVLHPATPNRVIETLALTASEGLLERILDNRVRLLEAPDILKNIKLNPAATPQMHRLVQEIEAEFFGSKNNNYTIEEASEREVPSTESSDLEAEPPPEDLSLEGLPVDPEEREAALLMRLSKMSVHQKIRHALLGTQEARSILIRDPNKQVARSVLQSPKLSEREVEGFASMRNVSEEVLREIGNRRAWVRNYVVVHNLIKNPKTPPMLSQRLMFRLLQKDLALLVRDRGVPEAVRRHAQRTLSRRSLASEQL